MHVRASRITADPTKAAADNGASYRTMVASMRQVEGFLGALLLVDRNDGRSLGLTFWESAQALAASEDVASELRRGGASTVGATTEPTVERYEVLYYGVPAPAASE
ncbi:MAG: antibiotic biosynthesis monooxygenase [Candidatus Dormibacteria bacterium]